MADPDELLVIEDVAREYRTSPATLYGLRHRGLGPPALRVGRRLLFRRRDVEAWASKRAERQ